MRETRSLELLQGRLTEAFGRERVSEHVRLAPFTTFRIGGPADLYFQARSADELARAVLLAREVDQPCFVLGLGANVLVLDGGFRGLVVHNGARSFAVDPENRTLYAESGAVVYPDLIEATVSAGLSGLEHFVGIPSTVGGALWQNLHFLSPPPARERTIFIEEVLRSADLLTEENQRKTVDCSYFEFAYDYSVLHHRNDIVLSATFALHPADPQQMREVMAANLEWRRLRHPPLDTEPSAGSIFKKIDGIGAGRLIDQCGLKGTRIGGAEITRRHANIMINRGGATAADVLALIKLTRETVLRETGHLLEPEILFVGEQSLGV
jgi:UDP-N-acetylmuramate dehydrogenase